MIKRTIEDFRHPYAYSPRYNKRVAYFCMEYGIDQAFKIYSGGLGFLAGSHMRSAYDLNQNMFGIGILWKFGYYDQVRKGDGTMDVLFMEKNYSFLEETGIKFRITVNRHEVTVKVYYLRPEVFGTVPMFFLSTITSENDYLAQSICFKLYDADVSTRIAQSILLGVGGAKLMDILNAGVECYHINEAHALPLAFYLYEKHGSVEEVKKRLVFTTHTPEEAGNEKQDIHLLNQMGFFGGLSLDKVREISGVKETVFNYSLVALRFAGMANAVSKLHGQVSNEMWEGYEGVCKIRYITNAQSKNYWADRQLDEYMQDGRKEDFIKRKLFCKSLLFEVVADQTGKLFDKNVLTIVWARRFAAYKRADLLTRDRTRFHALMTNKEFPVQIIWAGKPYPMDYEAMSTFNNLVHTSREYANCAVLVGYELKLSSVLKKGSDVWLNTPRVPREASGTSGMTAAMNGAINLSTNDGWLPEFARPGVNAFIVPPADRTLPINEQDRFDMDNFFDIIENQIIPLYYQRPDEWHKIIRNSMMDVYPFFDADRMAAQYYETLYEFD